MCDIVHECVPAIIDRLWTIEIAWPTDAAELTAVRRRFYDVAHMPCVAGRRFQTLNDLFRSGVLDGTHINLQRPSIDENQYVNRHGRHSINTQIVCDSHFRIFDCYANWPGSVHDQRVLRLSPLYRRWQTQNWRPFAGEILTLFNQCFLAGALLLADSGYGCTHWTITPLSVAAPGEQQQFNRAHKRTRRYVESGIGLLKQRWRCLHNELRVATPAFACRIIRACAIMHNICIRFRPPTQVEVEEAQQWMHEHEDGDAIGDDGGGENAPGGAHNFARRDQIVATFQ